MQVNRLCIAACAALMLAACAKTPVVSVPLAACAKLVPPQWSDGVPAAQLPPQPIRDADPEKDRASLELALNGWMKGYVNQSVNLSTANGRTKSAIKIVSDCEARANAARPDNPK